MLAKEEITRRLGAVRQRIAAAALQSRRAPESIRLVLATKTQPPEAILAACQAGAQEFGENYVQEAIAKQIHLGAIEGIAWHLIGHLQTNKVRSAVKAFDLIQTLDSLKLAEALERARPSPPVAVLIEVNIAGEASKSGVAPEYAERLIEAARGKVAVLGLMAIPPPIPTVNDARRHFAALRELRDRLAVSTGLALSELSMGMTDDFEIAIEEGATIVRVGRAVFGERKP
jgi:pyridoxal phosphate enzyme (YggS family)